MVFPLGACLGIKAGLQGLGSQEAAQESGPGGCRRRTLERQGQEEGCVTHLVQTSSLQRTKAQGPRLRSCRVRVGMVGGNDQSNQLPEPLALPDSCLSTHHFHMSQVRNLKVQQ